MDYWPKARGIKLSTSDWTCIPCIGSALNHWTTRSPFMPSLYSIHSILDVERSVTSGKVALCSLEQSLLEALFVGMNANRSSFWNGIQMVFKCLTYLLSTPTPIAKPSPSAELNSSWGCQIDLSHVVGTVVSLLWVEEPLRDQGWRTLEYIFLWIYVMDFYRSSLINRNYM